MSSSKIDKLVSATLMLEDFESQKLIGILEFFESNIEKNEGNVKFLHFCKALKGLLETSECTLIKTYHILKG